MKRGSGRGTVLAGVAGCAVLCSPARAQENRFDLAVRVLTTYDSNILRRADLRVEGNRDDDFSLSPQVIVDYRRRFGRQSIALNGTAGYVFNRRFRQLDRENITFSGESNLSFGPRCLVRPSASVFRGQSDLEDLGAVLVNTVTIQDYSVQASCPRPAGFFPVVSAGVLRTDNSQIIRRERDQSIFDGRVGIVYRRPSLGEAELFAQRIDISRARLVPAATGVVEDDSEVSTIGLRLGRDVGTRVSAGVSVAYTKVDPRAPGVPEFSGVTYDGAVTWRPQPRLAFTAGFGRSVSARGNLGTSYSVSTTASLSANARLTARTSAGASVQIGKRDFRGEDGDFLFGRGPRGADRQVTASANVSYALSRPVALTLSARFRGRDATNDFYDFSSFATTLGASLRL